MLMITGGNIAKNGAVGVNKNQLEIYPTIAIIEAILVSHASLTSRIIFFKHKNKIKSN